MTWHPDIDRALASLRTESEEAAANDASAALGWLVGEHGPALLNEARLQEFLWYVLPAKFLMPVEDQLGVAEALGRVLDLQAVDRSGVWLLGPTGLERRSLTRGQGRRAGLSPGPRSPAPLLRAEERASSSSGPSYLSRSEGASPT
jgi:hypothetical protein